MKYRLEGFYYGLLMSGFFVFMEWWQEGNIGKFFLTGICIYPFITAWYIGNRLKKGEYN